jgi:hypothetical protein
MDLPNDDWTSYVNPKTGEIVTVTNEDRRLVEDEDLDEENLPEWQRETLLRGRAALESDDFLALPDKSKSMNGQSWSVSRTPKSERPGGMSSWTPFTVRARSGIFAARPDACASKKSGSAFGIRRLRESRCAGSRRTAFRFGDDSVVSRGWRPWTLTSK